MGPGFWATIGIVAFIVIGVLIGAILNHCSNKRQRLRHETTLDTVII